MNTENENSYPEIQENKGSPPESQFENNSSEKLYECNSYYSSVSVANRYFGFDVFSFYTKEQVENMCRNPMIYNQELRELSLMLYSVNGIYSNTVDYMCALPTLDRVITTYGTNKAKKRKNKQLALDTLEKIGDSCIIRDALFRMMTEGIAFYYWESLSRPLSQKRTLNDYDVQSIIEINNVETNISIISLPSDYTRIIGIKNSHYVIAFNLDYFLNMPEGGNVRNKVRKYPKEIRDAFELHSKGQCDKWVVLDSSKTIALKIKSSRTEPYGRPLVISALKSILYEQEYTDTKRNVLSDISGKVIVQKFPESEKGRSSLTQSQQANQHNIVKDAILSGNKKGKPTVISVAAGTDIDKIDVSNTDILDEKMSESLATLIAGDLGTVASLLMGVGSGNYANQQANLELICSEIFMWIEQIESELNKCINANVIKDCRNYVKVNYLKISNVNKKEMVENCKGLYMNGKGSLTLWAATCGVKPDVFYALLDEELENDIENKYPVHKTSYTMSNKDTSNGAGRPESDSTNPETIASKSAGKNNIPTPSDK